MRSFLTFITEETDGYWWHGSPSGHFGSGIIHIGTHEAATQALNARIGVPASGSWDGSRAYGQTKLAGRNTLKAMPRGEYLLTGQNASPPDADYLPQGTAAYGDGSKISLSARPKIFRVSIMGKMANTQSTPLADDVANSRIKRAKYQGYYYKNIGEDAGSISACVPDASWLRLA